MQLSGPSSPMQKATCPRHRASDDVPQMTSHCRVLSESSAPFPSCTKGACSAPCNTVKKDSDLPGPKLRREGKGGGRGDRGRSSRDPRDLEELIPEYYVHTSTPLICTHVRVCADLVYTT